MISVGIDIGSRTVKLVAVQDGEITIIRKANNTFDPVAVGKELLKDVKYDLLTATGYGRHIFKQHFECTVISEIKAFATGASTLFPDCQAILDIGGQDTKVSFLTKEGRVLKFEMNDKCAAGTGRFLEIMASAMNYRIEDFGEAALKAITPSKISNMCTVFAESEVISLLNNGAKRDEVALGIHEAITKRVLSMLGRLPAFYSLVFAGGVAQNMCIKNLLERSLKVRVMVPVEPQIVGALGAALDKDRNIGSKLEICQEQSEL
jgi:predicted CoA-substrate-specific enzyme activase